MCLNELNRYGRNTAWSNKDMKGEQLDTPLDMIKAVTLRTTKDRLTDVKYQPV